MRKGSKKNVNVDKVVVQSRKFGWLYFFLGIVNILEI